MLRPVQVCKKCTFLGNLRPVIQEGNKEIRQITQFLSCIFWVLTVCDIHLCTYLKIVKTHFCGVFLLSILVCKIPEFWRCKLWDQNFVLFNSGNVHIKESKKPRFTFYRVENQICLISWSTFACSRMLFCIKLKLGLWNFMVIFLRMNGCNIFSPLLVICFSWNLHLKLSHEFLTFISFNIWS